MAAITDADDTLPTLLIGHRSGLFQEQDTCCALLLQAATWDSLRPYSASMGGAIAVHAAARGVISNLAGLVVIDVVEGTQSRGINCLSQPVDSLVL